MVDDNLSGSSALDEILKALSDNVKPAISFDLELKLDNKKSIISTQPFNDGSSEMMDDLDKKCGSDINTNLIKLEADLGESKTSIKNLKVEDFPTKKIENVVLTPIERLEKYSKSKDKKIRSRYRTVRRIFKNFPIPDELSIDIINGKYNYMSMSKKAELIHMYGNDICMKVIKAIDELRY